MAGQIMTVGEVAKYLSLDPQTVSRKAQAGELPAFKVGNRWRFDKNDIDGWIVQQKKGGPDLSQRVGRIWDKIRARADKAGVGVESIPELLSRIRTEGSGTW